MNYRHTYLLIAMGTMLCLGGCGLQEFEGDAPGEAVEYTLTADFAPTKTVNNGLATEWSANDALTVYYKSSNAFTSATFNHGEGNSFTGTLTSVDKPCDWYALYPASSSYSSPSSVKMSLASTMTQSGNGSKAHLAGEGFPLWGKAAGVSNGFATSISMHQVAAVARFYITNAEPEALTVTKIEFTAPSAITGAFTSDLTASSPVWTKVNGESGATATLIVQNGEPIQNGASADFFLGLFPFDQTGDFTVSVYGLCGGEEVSLVKTIENQRMVFPAGVITRIGLGFDLEDPIVAQDQTLSFAQDAVTLDVGYEQTLQLEDVIALPQTVSGAETEVTYYSSDASVAEIVNNSQIRIKGAGQTVITAEAAETELWNPAFASYDLVIVNHEEPARPVAYYVKVEEDPGAQSWGGTYLVVNAEGTKAFAAFTANASTYAVNVSAVDGAIESTPEIDAYALTVSGGTDKHANTANSFPSLYAYDVKNSDGKFIYFSESQVRVMDTNNNGKYTYRHTFAFNNDGIQMRSAGTTSGNSQYFLRCNNGSFIYEKDKTAYRVQLYRYQEGPIKHGQTLSFAEQTVTWTVGEGEDHAIGSTYALPQTVSGAQTAVTYSSSDSKVAQIVSGTSVKLVAPGNVTITATAAETDEYKSATASFSLVINDNTPSPEYFLGSFNLESNALTQYLDATTGYTDDNWTSYTVITGAPFSSMCGVGGEGYDFPTPVTVTWTGTNRQNVTVSIYTDSSRSAASLDQSVTSTSTSAKVYNLTPNRTYYYTVALDNGTEVDRGYFNTTGRRRQLKVTNTVSEDYATNVRDLGGMVTTTGGTLKYGLVYRGSNMRKIGNSEKAIIRDYMKVRLDVDLRKDSEWGVTATKVFDENEVAYSHVAYDGESMTDFLNKTKVNKTFSDIISYVSQGKAVYIHCKSGADRTGYVCMLIEAVCGVSLADCSKDYEITSFSKAGSRDRCGLKNNYLFQDALNHILSAQGSTFQEKAINTLKTDGDITDAQITALQNALME